MSENSSLLKAMLQDIINDRQEQAQASMHNYFIAKSREIAGAGSPASTPQVDTSTESEVESQESTEE